MNPDANIPGSYPDPAPRPTKLRVIFEVEDETAVELSGFIEVILGDNPENDEADRWLDPDGRGGGVLAKMAAALPLCIVQKIEAPALRKMRAEWEEQQADRRAGI